MEFFSDKIDIQDVCGRGKVDEVIDLIRSHAEDFNEVAGNGNSALMISLFRRDIIMIKWLLQNGKSELWEREKKSLVIRKGAHTVLNLHYSFISFCILFVKN